MQRSGVSTFQADSIKGPDNRIGFTGTRSRKKSCRTGENLVREEGMWDSNPNF